MGRTKQTARKAGNKRKATGNMDTVGTADVAQESCTDTSTKMMKTEEKPESKCSELPNGNTQTENKATVEMTEVEEITESSTEVPSEKEEKEEKEPICSELQNENTQGGNETENCTEATVEETKEVLLPNEVLEEVESFLKNRVTDKWLFLEKQKLVKKHVEESAEFVEDLLLDLLLSSEDEKYDGIELMELKQLIDNLSDPEIIESTAVSSYITIGELGVLDYIKQGGSYRCLLCENDHVKKHGLWQKSHSDQIPVFIVAGLTDVLSQFTETNIEDHCGVLAVKVVKENPFNKMVQMITGIVPNEYSPCILEWKKSIDLLQSGTEITSQLLPFQLSSKDTILQKMESLFRESKLPRHGLVNRKEAMKHMKITEEDIEKILYKDVLIREDFAGEDIIEHLLTPREEPREVRNHLATSVSDIKSHLSFGGSFHFILCGLTKPSIDDKSVSEIPCFSVDGLSAILNRYFPNQGSKAVIGFKKTADNPYQELVKLIVDTKHTLTPTSLLTPTPKPLVAVPVGPRSSMGMAPRPMQPRPSHSMTVPPRFMQRHMQRPMQVPPRFMQRHMQRPMQQSFPMGVPHRSVQPRPFSSMAVSQPNRPFLQPSRPIRAMQPRPRYMQHMHMQPMHMQPRHMQPRHMQPRHMQPRHMQPRHMQPRQMQPRQMQPWHDGSKEAIKIKIDNFNKYHYVKKDNNK